MTQKLVSVYLRRDDHDFLDAQLRAAAPQRRKGFPKTKILETFWGAMVIALKRPNHYDLGEMLYLMCMAAIKPEDTEGQQMIHNHLHK